MHRYHGHSVRGLLQARKADLSIVVAEPTSLDLETDLFAPTIEQGIGISSKASRLFLQGRRSRGQAVHASPQDQHVRSE